MSRWKRRRLELGKVKKCSHGSAVGPVLNLDDWNHKDSEQNPQSYMEIQQLLFSPY